jgi:prevent-host-death family protein
MKTTTIRELKHDTTAVLLRVAGGESVQVCRRGKPVAVLSPVKRKTKVKLPDFAARLKAIYGDEVLATPASEIVSYSRGES